MHGWGWMDILFLFLLLEKPNGNINVFASEIKPNEDMHAL